MNVLLIGNVCRLDTLPRQRFFLPYGLGLMKGFLTSNGISSKIFDYTVELNDCSNKNPDITDDEKYLKIFDSIDFNEFDCIVVSLSMLNDFSYEKSSLSLAEYVSFLKHLRLISGKKIIIGGNFSCDTYIFSDSYQDHAEWDVINQLLDYSDYLIINSDFDSLLDILNGSEVLYNVISKESDLISREVTNDITESIFNYDCDFDDLDLEKYNYSAEELLEHNQDMLRLSDVDIDVKIMVLPFIFTKNCNNSCSFCFSSCLLRKKGPSYLSVDNVISKLKRLYERYGIRDYYFLNNHISLSEEYLRNFATGLIESGLDIRWSDSIKINTYTPEIYSLLKKSGCTILTIGIDSISPPTLKYINKYYTSNEIIYTMKNIYDSDILLMTNYILGFPYQPHEEMVFLKKFLHDYSDKISFVALNIFSLYKGTDFFNNPQKYGIVLDTDAAPLALDGYPFLTFPYSEKFGLNWDKKHERNLLFLREMRNYVHNVLSKEKNRSFYSVHNHYLFLLDRLFKGKILDKRELFFPIREF